MENIELDKCNVSTNFKSNSNLWENEKFINDTICMKPNQDFNSSGLFGDNGYTGLVFWIHRCQNTTLKANCLPSEEIDRILVNVFFYVRFTDYYFNHKLIGDTGVPYIFADTVQASSTAYKRVWYNFQNTEYISDYGYIFTDNFINNYTTYGSKDSSVDLRLQEDTTIPGSFAVISLNMHPMKKVYQRKYYKAQNMIADLGGLFKGILLLAAIINYYFSERLYFHELIEYNSNSVIVEDDSSNPGNIIKSPEKACKLSSNAIFSR
jgi:hypothetical protein